MDGATEDRARDRVYLPRRVRRDLPGNLRYERDRVRVLDRAKPAVSEDRVDVQAQDALVQPRGARTVLLDLPPLLGVVAERQPAGLRIDVLPGDDRRRDFVEPALPVDLPLEVLGVFATFGVAVAGTPAVVGLIPLAAGPRGHTQTINGHGFRSFVTLADSCAPGGCGESSHSLAWYAVVLLVTLVCVIVALALLSVLARKVLGASRRRDL